MKKNINNIIELLKKNSLRVTKTRLAVAQVFITKNKEYLTSDEIHHIINNEKELNCDLVSVYRILTKYVELGVVKKSEFQNEAARYSFNDTFGAIKKHEHYFKCIKCFTIESFTDCFISRKEKELESSGYKNLSHHLEITGLCPSCA